MTTDFTLVDHGSIVIITPLSQQATEWTDTYLSEETQWWGAGFVVEPRYVDDIVDRMKELGMEVHPVTH